MAAFRKSWSNLFDLWRHHIMLHTYYIPSKFHCRSFNTLGVKVRSDMVKLVLRTSASTGQRPGVRALGQRLLWKLIVVLVIVLILVLRSDVRSCYQTKRADILYVFITNLVRSIQKRSLFVQFLVLHSGSHLPNCTPRLQRLTFLKTFPAGLSFGGQL